MRCLVVKQTKPSNRIIMLENTRSTIIVGGFTVNEVYYHSNADSWIPIRRIPTTRVKMDKRIVGNPNLNKYP